MNDVDQAPNPVEDLKHAHMLLAKMSAEELLRATYALEDIIEEAPWFTEKMRREIDEAKASGTVSTEELLESLGFQKEDFPGLLEDPQSKAA